MPRAMSLSRSRTSYLQGLGRVAQRESARFTRERSVVRNHPCPLGIRPMPLAFTDYAAAVFGVAVGW